jgi:hypothetical protein
MPIVKPEDSNLARSTVDPFRLRLWLRKHQTEGSLGACITELPQYRPGSSAQSLGTTGINFGILYACLTELGAPVHTVNAATWTQKLHSLDKRCHEIEDTKAKAKLIFDKLYPAGHGNPKIKPDHDGVIDAALIGFWWLWEQGLLARYKGCFP